MRILYKHDRLQAELTDLEALSRRYGGLIAKKILRRIMELRLVPNLAHASLYEKPLLCHQLRGNRREEYAVRVDSLYRIIFVPADLVLVRKPDTGIDTRYVTTICINELSKHYD